MVSTVDDAPTRLAAEAARIRGSGALGRSDQLGRLFEFLLQCSLEGRTPKEIEIGEAVFSRGAAFDAVQDSSVRVYVHRLRKKLQEINAASPAVGDRLIVPRGEYRLALADAPVESPADDDAAPPARASKRLRVRLTWIAVGFLAAVNALGWIAFLLLNEPNQQAARVAAASFWRPLAAAGTPTAVVLGDYYIFGEAPDGMQVTRLIRQFEINSRDDLDTYLMARPADRGRYIDVDLNYLPVGIGPALRDLLPIIDTAAARRPTVMNVSELTPNLMAGRNLVYVGFLSGLGILRDPVFAASGFTVGASYDELIDKASRRQFTSDWAVVANGKTQHRDYAYLASMALPAGKTLLIIAGTRDPAVMQAAEIASDRNQLARLAMVAGTGDFEALYEVRTLGNQNLGSALVLARSLKTDGIWQLSPSVNQVFPDQISGSRANR